MNLSLKQILTALFAITVITACASEPKPQAKHDPWNDADSQRSRADKAQGEL